MMCLAILVDVSTNRFSGVALIIRIALKSHEIAGKNASGDLEWPQMQMFGNNVLVVLSRPRCFKLPC